MNKMFSKSTVKYIQSLQHKKFRDEYGVFVAEGPKVVESFLYDGIFECLEVFAVNDWLEKLDANFLSAFQNKLTVVKDFELDKLSSLVKSNLVLALFKQKKVKEIDFSNGLSLALDDLQDPGNLGTIIRNADWFGVKQIICSEKTVDIYNPKVVQSTMASLGRVNVNYGNLFEILEGTNVTKYAAVLEGEDLRGFGKVESGILIIGNESKGISETLIKLADKKLTIPRVGEAESLNASVASAIILFSFTQ